MKLILVRHGETEWSANGRHTSFTDLPLTELGRSRVELASFVIKRMLKGELDSVEVFSSPLRRARETAEIICNSRWPIVSTPDLTEMNYGDYEGLTPQQIRESRPSWDIWIDGCPNGETVELVGQRMEKFIESVYRTDSTKLIFAHGHVLRILAARAIGLQSHQGRIFTLDTASVSVIEDVRGNRVLKLWNVNPSIVV